MNWRGRQGRMAHAGADGTRKGLLLLKCSGNPLKSFKCVLAGRREVDDACGEKNRRGAGTEAGNLVRRLF